MASHTEALLATLSTLSTLRLTGHTSPAAAACAASVCRALESMVGRPSTFRLRASHIRAAIAAAISPLAAAVPADVRNGGFASTQVPLLGGAAGFGCAFAACARLLRACVRHRAPLLRRWARAVLHTLSTLLVLLVQWSATRGIEAHDAATCAMHVAVVYQDMAASVRWCMVVKGCNPFYVMEEHFSGPGLFLHCSIAQHVSSVTLCVVS